MWECGVDLEGKWSAEREKRLAHGGQNCIDGPGLTVVAWVQENKEGKPQFGRAPRCIVLAPTRELAKQVEREFQASGPGLSLGCFYGGVSPPLAYLSLSMLLICAGNPF